MVASGSPRRRELLEMILGTVDIDPADIDETPVEGESADDLVVRLAMTKAETIADRHPGRTVLGADTVVVVDGEILGKPIDLDDAAAMLRRLSGRTHQVMTGVAVVDSSRSVVTRGSICEITDVRFRELGDPMIDHYLASGEADDKAGAYGIQGRASLFVEGIVGNHQNVVGLPVRAVDALMDSMGLALLDFEQPVADSKRPISC